MTVRRRPDRNLNPWIMVVIGTVPLAVTLISGLWTLSGYFATLKTDVGKQITEQVAPVAAQVAAVSNKVDSASRDAQTKVDALSVKIDAAAAVAQVKQDALTSKVDNNIAEQQQFRATVRDGFAKVYENQQKATEAIQQEKIDRLTDGKKK